MKINRTVHRTVEILTYIAAHPDGASMEELCEYFSLPRTSAYDILVTLVQMNMLSVKSGSRQVYQTGIAAYRVGMSYPDANDTLKLISAELKQLARQTDRTAFFGKLSGNEVLYILKEVPENPIITTATVGSAAPLYCTALGKTLLAFMPEEQSKSLLASMDIQPRTEHTVHSAEELLQELSVTRARGYSLDFREYEEHMVCTSAPVRQRDGSLEGAVSIAYFYRPDDDYALAGALVREKAAEISHLLGYRK